MSAFTLPFVALLVVGAPEESPKADYSLHVTGRIGPAFGNANDLLRIKNAQRFGFTAKPSAAGSWGLRIGLFERVYIDYRRSARSYVLARSFDSVGSVGSSLTLDSFTHELQVSWHPFQGTKSLWPFGIVAGVGRGRLVDADDRGFEVNVIRWGLDTKLVGHTGGPDELAMSGGLEAGFLVSHEFYSNGPPGFVASGTLTTVTVFFGAVIGLVSYAPRSADFDPAAQPAVAR